MENATAIATETAKGIQVTEKAQGKILAVLAKEGIAPAEGGIRLGVQGGGCSGLLLSAVRQPAPRA